MKGSISRSMWAERMARINKVGMKNPFTPTVTSATNATSQSK
jgi:hypothetical protein